MSLQLMTFLMVANHIALLKFQTYRVLTYTQILTHKSREKRNGGKLKFYGWGNLLMSI